MSELEEKSCVVCSYPFVDEHHIYPKNGCEDKELEVEDNKVFLCPNHHRAVHFLMFIANEGWSEHLTKEEANRKVELARYLVSKDEKLYYFYKGTLEPKIIERDEYYDRKTFELIAKASSA